MPETEYRVHASWDEDAGVWIAVSDDVPGLCAEADTLEALIAVILDLIPELLAANGAADPSALDHVPVRVIAERHAVAHRAA